MTGAYYRELDRLKRLYRELCNDSLETKRKLYNNPDRNERDALTEHLKLVRQLINDTTFNIRRTREYGKELDRRNPKNMKPKKFLDPRVENCSFRQFDTHHNTSLGSQRINGNFCLGTDCPYIVDADEFQTVCIRTIQRTLEEVLRDNEVDENLSNKIVTDLTTKFRNL